MLLQKIRTKGFLGHLANTDGEYVELDFADKNLWLIHGENGAGKSSLFDAVTMAFYKQHRGGKSAFENLIHSKADKAEVFVEFDLRGGKYQICVDVSKKSGVTRHLQFWNGANWETKNDDVQDWVARNLQITYDTFVSSILLRQGEADKFILAKPTPRREIFLELLQLEFYRKLGKSAAECKKSSGDQKKKAEQTLEGLEKPSAANIKNLGKQLQESQKELEKLERDESEKEREKQNAERAEDLQKQIAEIQARQKQDAETFERAVQTREKYNQFCELKEVVREFENVWREKKDIVSIEKELRENELKIAELTNSLAENGKAFRAQKDAETKARDKRNKLGKELENLEKKHGELKAKLGEIGKIEELEIRIEQEQADLKSIESELEKAKQKVEKLKSGTETKLLEKNELTKHHRDCEISLERWLTLRENRQQVIDKEECPLCGSELKDEETHRRLTGNFEEATAKVAELESQKENLREKLETVEAEFSVSANSFEAEKEKLQSVLLINESKIKTRIENSQNQLNELPKFLTVERGEIRNESAQHQDEIANLKRQISAANESFKSLEDEVKNLETKKIRLDSDLGNTEQNQTNLRARKQIAVEKLVEAENRIPLGWQNHAALQDENESKLLREQKDDLRSVEKEITKLTTAETDKTILESQLVLREKDLEAIPPIHRRESVEVKAELGEIGKEIALKKTQTNELDGGLRKMQTDKDRYDERNAELENFKKDYRLWSALAKAFGKQGLETKIVREAQHKIGENANQTLQALSNGNFQLELEESGEKMEIFVRDFTSGERRAIEYFSGGEKFLTAVSLAVAVGQSVSGQNIANTLIIDEGFGALDENKRGLMTKELNRLSDVLQDARVIVVSHQDDVQENFANRFRLEKTNEGFINVQVGMNL